MKTNEMFTVNETARILQVHPMTIYRMVKSGEIPYVRIRRSIRISKKYIENMTKDPINSAQKFIFG